MFSPYFCTSYSRNLTPERSLSKYFPSLWQSPRHITSKATRHPPARGRKPRAKASKNGLTLRSRKIIRYSPNLSPDPHIETIHSTTNESTPTRFWGAPPPSRAALTSSHKHSVSSSDLLGIINSQPHTTFHLQSHTELPPLPRKVEPDNILGSRAEILKSLPSEKKIHVKNQADNVNQAPKPLLELLPSELSVYYGSKLPPTTSQLNHARVFFQRSKPKLLYSAQRFFQIPSSDVPEVAFIGRSNVGKSSLLNSLLNESKLAYVSKRPGKTKLMNAFSACDGKLTVLDMPGYGHGSTESYGKEVGKYLKSRKSLQRVYLIVNGSHGSPKGSDLYMLRLLREIEVPHSVLVSKIDRVLLEEKYYKSEPNIAKAAMRVKQLLYQTKKATSMRKGEKGLPATEEIISFSNEKGLKHSKHNINTNTMGIDAVQWSVLSAADLQNDAEQAYHKKTSTQRFKEALPKPKPALTH